ncbi:hypothetical protein RHMOL_Rhmol12G0222500 [Rhododendron molle]|uniref:Uncharacterized protein n=1 Tax=Rhododendron molle TaxID=49168 RepID=A0ACC0LKY5_RHOML|nr:hypothetical protein RHMOL_Rhmol12G0222500 [Rhododendron molle]
MEGTIFCFGAEIARNHIFFGMISLQQMGGTHTPHNYSTTSLHEIWRNLSPPKVEVFVRMAAQDRIASRSVKSGQQRHTYVLLEEGMQGCPVCAEPSPAAVAPSGLSRRKPTSSNSPSPSLNRTPIQDPTRIVYGEPDLNIPFWQRTWFLVLLLVMGLSSFALAAFLFVTLDPDYTSSPVYAASSEGVEITYGSVIKLMHERTKVRLHSHDVPYGSGSGQQSVTGFPSVDDSNSYWIVRPELESSAKQGDTIKSGTDIRLQHMRTRRWLHSHLHASPISGNLEVSCFGGDGNSDTGDHWSLEIEGGGKTWRQDQRIRLHHVDTSGYLHSHDKKYTRIAGGQQEVCGVREKKADNVWLAAEGVYLPITETK